MNRIFKKVQGFGRLLAGILFFSLVVEARDLPWSLSQTARPGERVSLSSVSREDISIQADFDGDRLPDLATGRLVGGTFRIEIRLSSDLGPSTTCLVMNYKPPQAVLYALDIDGDNDLDLVVTDGFSIFPQAVWFGDGKGHFQDGNPRYWLTFITARQGTSYRNSNDSGGLVLCTPTERLPLDKSLEASQSVVPASTETVLFKNRITAFQGAFRQISVRAPPIPPAS